MSLLEKLSEDSEKEIKEEMKKEIDKEVKKLREYDKLGFVGDA